MKRQIIIEVISFLFVLLFVYAALNKLTDYQKFVIQLGQSPLLMGIGPHVAWPVITIELIIPIMLIIPYTRLAGFYASFSLMVMFTGYIVAILKFSSHIPCSCGGVLAKLGWTEHLIFNIVFVLLSATGVILKSIERTNTFQTKDIDVKKLLFITLSACAILSTLGVVLLSLISEEITNTNGSFLRAFRQHVINERLLLHTKLNSYYLAGTSGNTVFLGNYSVPLHVLSVDCLSGDSSHHSMQVKGIHDQKFWSIRLKIDSPHFYVYDGVVPRIYRGDLDDWKAERFKYDTEFFQDIEPMGVGSFAIRSLLGVDKNATLGKISSTEPHFAFKPEILKKQVDGVFCTAGYLNFDKQFNRLVYLYRYRNEFIVMDSNLHIINKGTTIDTNSIAKIQVATIQSSDSRVFQTPPLVVNNRCAFNGNYLFVNSALVSRNEPENALETASVIDVYNIQGLKYYFSFYIFDLSEGEKLRDFEVIDDKLIALFKTKLQIYDMDTTYFPGR